MPVTHRVNSEFSKAQFHKQIDIDFEKNKCTDYEVYPKGKVNTWPMKKTWRMWMRQTATWMAARGATMPLVIRADGSWHGSRPFNEQDAHELWVSTWLGVDQDGERFKTADGDRGKMLFMMDKHLAWAAERGLKLTIPNDGEYVKLKRASES